MNWKREVVDKLRRYDLMQHAARNIPEEISRLEINSKGMRKATACAVPTKGGGNRYEEMLINNLVQRQEMRWTLEQIQRWLQVVNRGMEALDPVEKQILERMYIYPESSAQERLCADLGIETSSLYRRRENALRKLTLAMYGTMES